ncbi:Mu-like prophage I protein [Thiomonas sp. CB3]|nr:Mu-like prophage I protein [Thiomonas sp. CB3]
MAGMATRTASRLLIAALSTQLCADGACAPAEVQLLPAGTFRAEDGRPADAPAWTLTAASAQRLISQVSARANPLVIDYEHQTLNAADNGQPAPAAGFFAALEWRDSGLWATGVRWTDKAAQMIAAGEYRYISPVFAYDKTGAVTRILHAGLTNNPALDGMAAVAAASYQLNPYSEPTTMDDIIERLVYLLNLPVTSTPEEIAAQLDKLKAQLLADAQSGTAAATFSGIEVHIAALKAKAATATEQVAALKATSQPAEVVVALKAELATLTAAHNARVIDDLVKPALADGRLLPTQEVWARDLGASNQAALTAYLQTAQPIAALTSTQTGGKPQGKPTTAQDDPDAIADLALKHQRTQAEAGIQISTAQAVAHVLNKAG